MPNRLYSKATTKQPHVKVLRAAKFCSKWGYSNRASVCCPIKVISAFLLVAEDLVWYPEIKSLIPGEMVPLTEAPSFPLVVRRFVSGGASHINVELLLSKKIV